MGSGEKVRRKLGEGGCEKITAKCKKRDEQRVCIMQSMYAKTAEEREEGEEKSSGGGHLFAPEMLCWDR